jgi:hypothetical protein
MLDDVADVASIATVAKPVPRGTDKAALAYLEASGARAISVTADVDGAAITVGLKPDAVAVFWLPEAQAQARSVAARARAIVGDNPDTDAAISALQEAATECRSTLTSNDVAMTRAANAANAANAAERLDRYMDSLKGSGTLKQFTHTYRLWRKAAARGEGFMPFSVAELRFKRALIPLLMNGGKPPIGTSFFSAIFDTK